MSMRRAMTLMELLVVIAIVMIVFSLTLSGVNAARESARKIYCSNTVRQLSIAMDEHHLLWNRLPSGTSADSRSRYQGWPGRLLPFLEQQPMANEIDAAIQRTSNLFDTSKHEHFATAVPSFTCPSDRLSHSTQTSVRYGLRVGLSSYLACSGKDQRGKDGVFLFDSGRRYAEVTDGLSNTIFLGERPTNWRADLGWWYAGLGVDFEGTLEHRLGVSEITTTQVEYLPCAASFSRFQKGDDEEQCHMFHYWSYHTSGCWFAFGDCSVHFVSYSIDPLVLNSLSTSKGGEVRSFE